MRLKNEEGLDEGEKYETGDELDGVDENKRSLYVAFFVCRLSLKFSRAKQE